jgi:hypothetical protein
VVPARGCGHFGNETGRASFGPPHDKEGFFLVSRHVELFAAYEATDYVAFVSGQEITVRLGYRSRDLDRVMIRFGVGVAALITAFNPYSINVGRWRNLRANQMLRAALRQCGYKHFEGEGRGASADWPPEPSYLVLGIERAKAIQLGRRFRQNALVYFRMGRRAELVFPSWPSGHRRQVVR